MSENSIYTAQFKLIHNTSEYDTDIRQASRLCKSNGGTLNAFSVLLEITQGTSHKKHSACCCQHWICSLWSMAHINYAARANQNALTIHDSSVDLNYNMDRSNDSVAPFAFPQRSEFIHNLTCSRSICGIFIKAAGNHICYLLWAFFRHPAVAHNSA